MGIRIQSIDGMGMTCLFDSVSGIAFGPMADEDQLSEFLKWCCELDKPDLRSVPEAQLMEWWQEFVDSAGGIDEGLQVVRDQD